MRHLWFQNETDHLLRLCCCRYTSLSPKRGLGSAVGEQNVGYRMPVKMYHWVTETRLLTAARGVIWCKHEAFTVILSLRTGQYLTLDEIGGLIWQRLCEGVDCQSVAKLLSREFDVDESVVLSDVIELVDKLHARRLLELRETPVNTSENSREANQAHAAASDDIVVFSPPVRPPPVLWCIAALTAFQLSLKIIGCARILRFINRVGIRSGSQGRLPDEWLSALAANVQRAALFCPLRAACLSQSLLVLWVLRRTGASGDLRIGVNVYPFRAHAWVEHCGRPIDEGLEDLHAYQLLSPIDLARV